MAPADGRIAWAVPERSVANRRAISVDVRVDLRTGEIDPRDGDIGGVAVHVAQRVCAIAEPGEVLVSEAIPLLLAGSGIGFQDRGARELKGVPGSWRLFAARACPGLTSQALALPPTALLCGR
jgi:class 3 adenylate cyclase